jgi:hypothetical protein
MVSAPLNERDLKAVHEVIANANLRSIEYYEVSARRHESPPHQEDQPEGQVSITVQERHAAGQFGVRLLASVVVPMGEVTASVAGEYDLADGFEPSRRALQNFANEVAVMTVFPYLRESIATASARVLGRAIQLPVIERGSIALDVDAAGIDDAPVS